MLKEFSSLNVIYYIMYYFLVKLFNILLVLFYNEKAKRISLGQVEIFSIVLRLASFSQN